MVVVSPKKVRTYSAHFSDPKDKNYSEGKFGGPRKKSSAFAEPENTDIVSKINN